MKLNQIILSKDGVRDCSICGGVGFYLEEIVSGSTSGALILCNCVIEYCYNCQSKGKPPFLTYEESLDKMIPCFCHSARVNLKNIERLIQKSNIPHRYKFKFLNSIDTRQEETDTISLLVAYDWADELVKKWQQTVPGNNSRMKEKKGMYLWGGTGSGKTLLACVILNELIFRYGTNCRYAKINKDFLNALKDTYQKDSDFHGQERFIEEEFTNVDVLVIDDFGVHRESDWVNEKLYDLIDSRYERKKITLLTSNSSLNDWKGKWNGRIFSRLNEMTIPLQLECSDYRLKFR